jgi:hypothetical protein
MGNNHTLGRRSFLGLLGGAVAALVVPIGSAVAAPKGYLWPNSTQWGQLRNRVGSKLIRPKQPWATLTPGAIPARLINPWFLEEQPGATQSTGMYLAWESTASEYAIAARNVADIVACVVFGRV